MNSPARSSMQRKLAAMASTATGAARAAPMPETGPVATEYQLLLASLGVDLRALSDIQSIERKIEAKREMIERYRPWVEGALTADTAAQDEIVATMLIWSVDVAEWSLAVPLAKYVFDHGIQLPERYKRQPATLIAEEVAEAGLTTPPTVDYDTLISIDALTASHDMHDQVRAKLKKAIGLALHAMAGNFDPEAENAPAGGKAALIGAALSALQRAMALDPKVGVKKLIESLEREQRKSAEQEKV